MSWNYRIVEHSTLTTSSLEKWYCMHEAYYGPTATVKKPTAITQHCASPFGENVDELIDNLKAMLSDAKKYKNKIIVNKDFAGSTISGFSDKE